METGEQIGDQDVQIRILEETGNHAFITNTIISSGIWIRHILLG